MARRRALRLSTRVTLFFATTALLGGIGLTVTTYLFARNSLLEHYPRRASAEAHYRPFAYSRARAVAFWSLSRGRVTVDEPFAPLKRAEQQALAVDADDLERFVA